jgi:sugar/nucleoside kinase (ribokinase family)
MSGTYDAVVAGHLCLDIIPQLDGARPGQFEKMFLPGRLLEVGPVTLSTGGAVSNTGLALNKLGIKTQLMGKIGDDLFGQAVKQIVGSYVKCELRSRVSSHVSSHGSRSSSSGPDLVGGMTVDKIASTSYTIIISPPGLDRMFLHCPGANDTFGADDVHYDLVSNARLFHFGYPTIMKRMHEQNWAQLVELFRRAKGTGVTTSLDMSFPDQTSAAGRADWANILESTLPYVDLFLPNIEETLYMLHRETYEELYQVAGGHSFLPLVSPQLLSDVSRGLLNMGAKIVALKLGDRGLYVRTAGRSAMASIGPARPSETAAWADKELWGPCFKVNVVGTTGAGDATVAGFLSALLRDMSPEAALMAAVAVGACNVEAADALGGLRTWDETLRRVESGWARHELRLDAPGWRFDESHHLWTAEGNTAQC